MNTYNIFIAQHKMGISPISNTHTKNMTEMSPMSLMPERGKNLRGAHLDSDVSPTKRIAL